MQARNNWPNTKQFQMNFAHSQNHKLSTMMEIFFLPSRDCNLLLNNCNINSNIRRKKNKDNKVCKKSKLYKKRTKLTGKMTHREKRHKNVPKECKCKCEKKMNCNSRMRSNMQQNSYSAKSSDNTKALKVSKPATGTNSKIYHKNTIASSSSNTTHRHSAQQSRITCPADSPTQDSTSESP